MKETIEQAQKEGYDSGTKAGESRLSALISGLIEEQRMDDLTAALKGAGRREELYRKYADLQ